MYLIEESEPILQGDMTPVDWQLDARLVAINEHLPAPIQKDAHFFAVAVGDVLELSRIDAFADFLTTRGRATQSSLVSDQRRRRQRRACACSARKILAATVDAAYNPLI